jgi:hypothetical protein
MNPTAPQGIVRTLLVEADHLSRLAYADHEEILAARFAALRTELARVERRFGASPPRITTKGELDLLYQRVCDVAASAEGREPKPLLEEMVSIASKLRAPRPKIVLGGTLPDTIRPPPAH